MSKYYRGSECSKFQELPWWLSVKNPSANARDMDSMPGSGFDYLEVEQLSPYTMTVEPVPWSLGTTAVKACTLCSLCAAAKLLLQ